MSPARPPAPRVPAAPPRPAAPRPAAPSPAVTPTPPTATPRPRRAADPAPRTATGGAASRPVDADRTAAAARQPSSARAGATPSARRPRDEAAPTAGTEGQAAPSQAVTTYQVRRFGGPARPTVVSTRSQERFAERARARRNLARRQVVLVVSGIVGALGLAWLLLLSPVLALDPAQVTVTGAGTVVAVDQVQAVVALRAGEPLPRLDTVRLRDDLLQVPGVREVRVMRDWPRGLSVTLVSREPVAAVPEVTPPAGATTPGFALLDQDGVQVGRADAASAGLPVVDVPVDDARTLTGVLAVLRRLPADLLAQVQAVSATSQDTISLGLRDGATVVWGSADETPLKIAVLTALRASPAAAGASVIDVSAPRMPITK